MLSSEASLDHLRPFMACWATPSAGVRCEEIHRRTLHTVSQFMPDIYRYILYIYIRMYSGQYVLDHTSKRDDDQGVDIDIDVDVRDDDDDDVIIWLVKAHYAYAMCACRAAGKGRRAALNKQSEIRRTRAV